MKKRSSIVIAVIVIVLILDQMLKIWVKTNMAYNEQIPLFGNWGFLHFVENPGMAFGIEFGGNWGKLALSLFRIVAVIFLAFYLRILVKSKASIGFLVSAALILAGALGNIIDSAFYGLIFSGGGMAELFPDKGYAGFLHGRVVDMFYFPMFKGHFPDWFPVWAGEPYTFFRPVFNIADSAITIGVASIILFYRSYFSDEEKLKPAKVAITTKPVGLEATKEKDTPSSPDSPTPTDNK